MTTTTYKQSRNWIQRWHIHLPCSVDLDPVDVAVTGRQTDDAVKNVLAIAGDTRVGARVEADSLRDRFDGQLRARRLDLAPRRPVDAVAVRKQRLWRPALLLLTGAVVNVRRPPGGDRLPQIYRKLAVGWPGNNEQTSCKYIIIIVVVVVVIVILLIDPRAPSLGTKYCS